MKKINIGIVGFGEYSLSYLDLWLAHPRVGRVVGAEFIKERRDEVTNKFGVQVYESYEKMLAAEPDLDCIGIFSQRHQHGPMVLKALELGKHVFSAVPMGITEEEVLEILRISTEKRLIYMMAETCYYFPCAVWQIYVRRGAILSRRDGYDRYVCRAG